MVQQIPAKSLILRGLFVDKTTAVFPRSLLSFHFTALIAYIKQTPGISPALPWQNFGQSPAHFHGYPPPSPEVGGEAWLQMTSALFLCLFYGNSFCRYISIPEKNEFQTQFSLKTLGCVPNHRGPAHWGLKK